MEDINYLAKENPADYYYIVVGGIVNIIGRSGFKSVLHSWNDEDYKHLEVIESKAKNYLRFEFEHNGIRS